MRLAYKETEDGLDGVEATATGEEGLATSGDGPTAHDEGDPNICTEFL